MSIGKVSRAHVLLPTAPATTVIERAFNGFIGAALRLDTTSTPSSIEAVSSSPPPSSGSPT